ncbi:cupredoxin domain-containing protein [Methanoregula sp.]|uniref:cupredoxin domain-containing protein n=1 Tax=Methanoregula sp. TaxID=2052170 RepID=UPI003C731564
MTSISRFRTVFVLLSLLALAVAITGCTANQNPAPQGAGPATPAAGPGSVSINNFAFSPRQVTVSQGTTVTWTNQDSVAHTVVSDAGVPDAFSSDPLSQGSSFTFTFTKPGTYTYHCSIHPSMTGTVTVTS